MSIDTYAVCPCGSGKKIKFCYKCKDSLADLDSVMKMVEGGQVVPALDRLASILDEHPDAAWALAIRGRLLLDLREYNSLSENADRFIRLQPSNPLALTQRAAARLFGGEIESATESMLKALTESGREVDAFVLDVASVLAYSLAQQGIFLTARVYATLAMMTPGYEGGQTAVAVLQQLNSSPSINQYLKSIPPEIPRPADAGWGERYDEAVNLLRSNKIDLAESKFQSLQRVASGEPSILSGLLTCAIWRGDVGTQADMFKALSACESLDLDERAKHRAIAAVVNPQSQEVSVATVTLNAEIDNVDEVEMALTAGTRFVSLPAEMISEIRAADEEIPPRAAFQVINRDKPESIESLPPVDDVPEALGLILIYGKQTDRAARIEVLDVSVNNVDVVRTEIGGVLSDMELASQPGDPTPLLVAAQPATAIIRYQTRPEEAQTLQRELIRTRMPESIVSLRVALLGGESLESIANDETKLLERTAMMRVIEQYDALASHGDDVLARVYELAGLQPQPPIKPTSEQVETIANEDLNRVDPSELDAESLIYLLQRAQQVSATPAIRRFAEKLLNAQLTDEQKPARLLAYMTLINTTPDNEEALKLLEQAKAYGEDNNMPIANLLLTEVQLRVMAGDGVGFQKTVETIASRYGNEPEVMARLQQMLVAYGLIRPDGSMQQAPQAAVDPTPAAESASELWTPDSGSPTASAPKSGGGKLWIPGMD